MIREKLKIPFPIIVEGRYDRIAVLGVAEATVLTTEGFGIFKSHEKRAVLRTLAQKTPIIILTDSDGAGKVIRSHIKGILPSERTISVYIPQIKGKERRKNVPSKEGTLGVEGMDEKLLYDLLEPYENVEIFRSVSENPLSKTDFFNDGLCGGRLSSERRDKIAQMFNLPCGMTSNALISALKIICSYEEYKQAIEKINY